MIYAIWNNKGGVGKSFLSFVLSTELANSDKKLNVILVDMCPQSNVSEIVLGGNGSGAQILEKLINERKTIGGYFDSRIKSPHTMTGSESQYLLEAEKLNKNMPENLYIIPGDSSLELQAQVINQISAQTLPENSWQNVHNWLKDLITACTKKIGGESVVFIDCNPSFSSYTEISMIASDRLIIPCSSDGSSARAIDNVGALLYDVQKSVTYNAGFSKKAKNLNISLPLIHSVILNRSTQYNQRASKAFGAMFDEIKTRTENIKTKVPGSFVGRNVQFVEIPDNHSVAIVCSHLGKPLYTITPGKYDVHDTNPQVNREPLDRYKLAVENFIKTLLS